MGVIVTVKQDFSNVAMPDGKSYSRGQQCTLTDTEYASLPQAVTRCVTLTQSGVADPTRYPVTPYTLAQTLVASKSYTDQAVHDGGVDF